MKVNTLNQQLNHRIKSLLSSLIDRQDKNKNKNQKLISQHKATKSQLNFVLSYAYYLKQAVEQILGEITN
ncbi:hypothetical protein pb186bvf_011245 [Paramecium bursaria]